MSKDKFNAIWVSHSSISDFLKCPRAYYLKNVYKDPVTNHKVQIITPSLALGQVVHEVIESLSIIPTQRRFEEPLSAKFERAWTKVSGKKGGFNSEEQEQAFKKRGEIMIDRVKNNPGPLNKLAVKIQMDLPHYWMSEEDNIILCGKIDWLEYFKDSDSVHIIDFKTSKHEEKEDSMQLPIYHLLVRNCQGREVQKASYWYLDKDDSPVEQQLPDVEISEKNILAIAKKIKLARQLDSFKCPNGDDGCFACKPFEKIVKGMAEKVGINDYNQDIYIVEQDNESEEQQSLVL
ncbi:PD-(D/E)XK nuclease family protein [Candidatus Dojkabacteria bacterium]|nr:PD-(D/E)XK nuclease family protein [Candidatus Dojkabacteria bacterium]